MKHIICTTFVLLLLFIGGALAAEEPAVVVLKGHTDALYTVSFSFDGKKIATASRDKTVRIWDAESGKELQKLEGTVSGRQAWSPDGKKIATVNGGIPQIWDTESGKKLQQLVGHQGSVMTLAFSPDSKKVVTGGVDRTVRIWDAESGNELQNLQAISGCIQHAVFSPDGRKVMSASAGITNTIIWDAEMGFEWFQLESLGNVARYMNERIIVTSSPKGFSIWDAESGIKLNEVICQQTLPLNHRISPDFKTVAVPRDGVLSILDIVSGIELQALVGIGNVYLNGIAWSPDGKKIATASTDGTAKIWNLERLPPPPAPTIRDF